MNIQSIESQAIDKAISKVSAMSDNELSEVWKAANSKYAYPEHGYGTYINGSWVVLEWDIWLELLYSELDKRCINVL